LKEFDYTQPGMYFVTICVQERRCLFGRAGGEVVELNDAGTMIGRWWASLATKFPHATPEDHVVMPNHFHGLVAIVGDDDLPRPAAVPAPALADIVAWFKSMTTNEYIRCVKSDGWPSFRGKLWQRGYYEHIVRGETDLAEIRQYIADNPARWVFDSLYSSA
jgi:REP element-mobilizing transposase RayT